MHRYLTPTALIAAWLAFAFAAPRVFSGETVTVLALAGMAVTVGVLAVSGHVSRPDPLSLNLTGRRPWWETR
ncbi:MAG: hypothetical protein ACLFQ5_05385 [Oceanicaulis sp.]